MYLVQYAKDSYTNIDNIIDMSIVGLDIIINVQGYTYDEFLTVKPDYAENFLQELQEVDRGSEGYLSVYKQRLQEFNSLDRS